MNGGLNLYEYAGGNPISFADPAGLRRCECRSVVGAGANLAGGALSGMGMSLDNAIDNESKISRAGQVKMGQPGTTFWDRSFHLDGPHGRVKSPHINAEIGPLRAFNHQPIPEWAYKLGSETALRNLAHAALVAGIALDAYDIATASECERGRAIGGAIGGWGGAAAGAAIGSGIVPGVGTVIGGLIGGFGGAILGQVTGATF